MSLGPEGIAFLKRLKRNNKREWFQAHQAEYHEQLKLPARQTVEELRALIQPLYPQLEMSPRSVYRINRDTRFSEDKTPYKTWVGFYFWDRRFAKDQAPGLYIGMDPTGIALGGGCYRFESMQRAIFRERVMDGASLESFARALVPLKKTRFELKGRELKKIPRGYDPDHPHAQYLLHNGLFASKELDFPKSFGSSRFSRELARLLEPTVPLMRWFADNLPR